MFRKIVCAMFALALFTGIILAEDAKGKFKSYTKGALTLTVKDKDVEYKMSKETKVFDGDSEQTGKDRGKLLKGLKEGAEVAVTFDDKMVLSEVKVQK